MRRELFCEFRSESGRGSGDQCGAAVESFHAQCTELIAAEKVGELKRLAKYSCSSAACLQKLRAVNRIDEKFAQLRSRGEKAFIAYISAGDPTLAATCALTFALEKAGVDILELGVPFSDPLADGIVNQLAAQRALEAGATPRGVLDCVREIRRDSQIPIVLYTYMNPLYAFGFAAFHREAERAGVDGLLILDLPPDEDRGELSATENLKRIRLIAPTTPLAAHRGNHGARGRLYILRLTRRSNGRAKRRG